jgi:hypothetical protein
MPRAALAWHLQLGKHRVPQSLHESNRRRTSVEVEAPITTLLDLLETHLSWITSISVEIQTIQTGEVAGRKPNNMTKKNILKWALLMGYSTLCTTVPATIAQEPIRVKSNEVLVPVFVLDKGRARVLQQHPEGLHRAILAGDAQLVDKIQEETVIHDLTAADFQILDDGKEQAIDNISYEQTLYWDVRDNAGHHTEYLGSGGGKWSTVEWPENFIGDLSSSHYLIAYALPESPDGSCHQIQVKVNRRNALVSARSEYCNTNHSPSDPVNGTKLGEQLESDLSAPGGSSVDISILAIPLYSNSRAARVHISLDWPWESLRGKTRTKGILGMVFRKDGSLVTRFSDLADRYGVPNGEVKQWWPHHGDRPEINLVENRYDGQVELLPGEYELRVALGDGTRFGRAKIPLTVDSHDRKELSISPVSLCRKISDVSVYARKLSGAWTAKLPGGYVPLVSNDTEFKPTSNARFKATETLYVYFEAYEPLRAGSPEAEVNFQVRIVDLKTGELKSDTQPISAVPYLKPGSSIIPIGRGIDITKLPRASYRLDVRVTDSTGKGTDWHRTNFTVE